MNAPQEHLDETEDADNVPFHDFYETCIAHLNCQNIPTEVEAKVRAALGKHVRTFREQRIHYKEQYITQKQQWDILDLLTPYLQQPNEPTVLDTTWRGETLYRTEVEQSVQERLQESRFQMAFMHRLNCARIACNVTPLEGYGKAPYSKDLSIA